MNKKGLGKGLGAIFGEAAGPVDTVVEPVRSDEEKQELLLKDIVPNPHQPRQVFDAEKLAELVESIKLHGSSSHWWYVNTAVSMRSSPVNAAGVLRRKPS